MTKAQIKRLPVGALLLWDDFAFSDFDFLDPEGATSEVFLIVERFPTKDYSVFVFEPTSHWFRQYLIEERGAPPELTYSVEFMVEDEVEIRRIA